MHLSSTEIEGFFHGAIQMPFAYQPKFSSLRFESKKRNGCCRDQNLVGRFSAAATILASPSIVCGIKSEAAADDDDDDGVIYSIPDDDWPFRPSENLLSQKTSLGPANA